jgi:DNA mismatch endonuclease (patch repair protein)
MGRIRDRDTLPERRVRSALHRMGYRFRLHRKDLPGRPDIVLPRHRIVILVHGCFWHRHYGCPNCTTPTANRGFWLSKFSANVERDRRAIDALRQRGWKVGVIWECETESVEQLRHRLQAVMSGR